jgi:hypothetical protein
MNAGNTINGRRMTVLEFLVFRLGGVAGATRRIIFGWPGGFTANQIRLALAKRYPRLTPANGQIEDIIAQLVQYKHLIIVCNNSHGVVYKRATHRPAFRPVVTRKIKQLKLNF